MDPKPIPSHRFLQAQHQRTLLHPKLLQPTEEYERLHKLKLASCGDSRDSLENPERVPLCLPCAPVPAIANVQNHNDEYPPHLSKKNGLYEDDADTSSSSSQSVRGATRTHAGTAIDINSEMGQTRVNNEVECHSPQHTFVVCADSQLGMTSLNAEWETELDYCRQAVHQINNLEPRPKFVTACGDLVDMEQSFYYNNEKSLKDFELKECERIQKKQFDDWKHVFDCLHEDIALVCLCGNHDIGNRPTPQSIEKFTDAFGDEYLAFWVNGTYNIALNNVLFINPDGAPEQFQAQLKWLEERLIYANAHHAAQIYVFAHHPWFLYNDDEEEGDFDPGVGSAFPPEWDDGSGKFDGAIFPDSYFSMPLKYRTMALTLFEKYNVSASFSGHFHQNLVSKSSFGMDMIVTGPLSMVFESTGKPTQSERDSRGIRVVEVNVDEKNRSGSFTHHFESLDEDQINI